MAGSQDGKMVAQDAEISVTDSSDPIFEGRSLRAIETMRRRLETPPSLGELAQEAGLSPWHFHRSFRKETGIPPGRFLSSLRMAEAKRLLIETNLSVTDICFELGFESLGSFTSRFTTLVGLPPVAFRRLVDDFSPKRLIAQLEQQERWKPYPGLRGVVTAPASFSGPVFVGLFPQSIPERFPKSGILLMGPGPFRLPCASPEGFLMAAGIASFHDPISYLLPRKELLVGILPLGQRIGLDQDLKLPLRSPKPLDPPILLALLACLGRPNLSPG